MFSVLISVSASFAADENATDLVMDTQKEDIVEFSNQNEIVEGIMGLLSIMQLF